MGFNEKLYEVLRNFMEYGNYQGKPENAIKIIVKSFPDKSRQSCADAFNNAQNAYKDAIIMVNQHMSHYADSNATTMLPAEKEFREKHDQVPPEMLTWIIGWIYHWYHER